MAQIPTVTEGHDHLQQRDPLSAIPLSIEMQVLLDPIGYVGPAGVPAPVSAIPAAHRVEAAKSWLVTGVQIDLVFAVYHSDCGHYSAQH